MHPKIGKQLIAAFIVLLLATSSAAAQEEIYLPRVGDITQQEQQPTSQELASEPHVVGPVEEVIIDYTLADGPDPDAPGSVSADSREQDGDAAWAQPPEGLLGTWDEVTAAAFNANNWYVQNKLGVGTDTPVHRVELNDNVNWINRLLVRNNNSGDGVTSDIYLTTGTSKGLMIQKYGSGFNKFNWSGIALADYARIRTDTGVKGLIQTTANGPMYFGTGDTERLRIHANGGMTIRNTNSSFGLRIEGTDLADGIQVNNAGPYGVEVRDAGYTGLYIYNPGGDGVMVNNADNEGVQVRQAGGIGVKVEHAGIYGVYVGDTGDDGVVVSSADGDGVRINWPSDNGLLVNLVGKNGVEVNEPGNDGVAVICPCGSGNGVYVEGGNIRVNNGSFIDDGTTLNVPDYVFEEEYPLMSLDELQAFIETEKHLPNVPSEEEIHADGLDLGEFHMHLLEKVEELTLYTLQQEEVIRTQRAELDAQQAQIDALVERLTAVENKQ